MSGDAIVLDVLVPREDGFATCGRVKAHDRLFSRTTVRTVWTATRSANWLRPRSVRNHGEDGGLVDNPSSDSPQSTEICARTLIFEEHSQRDITSSCECSPRAASTSRATGLTRRARNGAKAGAPNTHSMLALHETAAAASTANATSVLGA